MIVLNQLTDKDVGREVSYTNGAGDTESGRIKRWNNKWIFVVYNCDENWSNYQDYTAAATSPEDLNFAETRDWDSETTRFDLIDFD